MSSAAPLKYKLKWQVRAEIADAVLTNSATVYNESRTGFVKSDLVQVAYALGVESPDDQTLGDLTLAELYRAVSEAIGMDPPETAGNQWSLNKPHLKAIHRRVVDE